MTWVLRVKRVPGYDMGTCDMGADMGNFLFWSDMVLDTHCFDDFRQLRDGQKRRTSLRPVEVCRYVCCKIC